MIEREFGETRLVCDEPLCGNSQPQAYASDEFNEMIADAKIQGWSIRSGRGEWTHKCPDCAAREAVEFEEVDLAAGMIYRAASEFLKSQDMDTLRDLNAAVARAWKFVKELKVEAALERGDSA